MEAPEGWYPDPEGLDEERYWDGLAWTAKTRRSLTTNCETELSTTTPPLQETKEPSRVLKWAISEARSQAGRLNIIAAVLSAIGITGGVIVVLLGLLLAFNEEQLMGSLLILAGVIGVLVWTFIGTLAQTFGKAIDAWMLWMDERG